MNPLHDLTTEQRVEVCEDIIALFNGRRLGELAALRARWLREHREPTPWQYVDADHIARKASSLLGGSPAGWQEAALAALGVSSRLDVCLGAVREMADDVRADMEPDERHYPKPECPAPQQRTAPSVTVGHRHGKRGQR
jgi:hypothetical protein